MRHPLFFFEKYSSNKFTNWLHHYMNIYGILKMEVFNYEQENFSNRR